MTIYSYHATHLLIGGLQRVGELLLLSITHSFIWLHQYELCVFELYDHSLFYWLVYPCCSLKLFHLDAVRLCLTVTSPVLWYFSPPQILPVTPHIFPALPYSWAFLSKFWLLSNAQWYLHQKYTWTTVIASRWKSVFWNMIGSLNSWSHSSCGCL